MILITGGGGLLGLNLAKDLAYKGEDVLILQKHKTDIPPFLSPFWGKKINELSGDILDWPFLCELMTKYPIDSIVHAAAIWPGRVGTSSLDQVISVNIIGTKNMLEIARIYKLRRLTFISSETVYIGMDSKEPCREDMNLPVDSPEAISATKKACEQICGLYNKTHGISVISLRVARIYGPTAHWGRNPMERMIVNSVAGKPANIGDTFGGSYVVPIHAKDCARGISLVHLAKELKYNIYNLADGNHVTYNEISNIIREIIPGANISLSKDKKLDMSIPAVSIERLKSEGWKPDYADMRKGIKAYIDYLSEGKY